MTRPRVRRDIILDSGGLTELARGDHRAQAWLEELASAYEPPVYLVPVVVLTEVLTGDPRSDARVHRFIKAIDSAKHPGAFWLNVSTELASRAGELRTLALQSRSEISAVDAQVAALAEDRSRHWGVTILTSDPGDLEALIDAITPRPRNIAVEGV